MQLIRMTAITAWLVSFFGPTEFHVLLMMAFGSWFMGNLVVNTYKEFTKKEEQGEK